MYVEGLHDVGSRERLGCAVGRKCTVGTEETVGTSVGLIVVGTAAEGTDDGYAVGNILGQTTGAREGELLGKRVGQPDGSALGRAEGALEAFDSLLNNIIASESKSFRSYFTSICI